MKKSVITAAIMVVTIAAICIAGCTSPSSSTSNQTAAISQTSSTNSVGANVTPSNGTPITAQLGQNFTIRLPTNPSTSSTGWQAQYDTSRVALKNETYVPTQPVTPGSGGTQISTFQGLKAGATAITMFKVSQSGTVTERVRYPVTVT
jgi:predicted secreted protein